MESTAYPFCQQKDYYYYKGDRECPTLKTFKNIPFMMENVFVQRYFLKAVR